MIYSDIEFNDKTINSKLNSNEEEFAHNKLRPGSLVKIINPETNDSIILKVKRDLLSRILQGIITQPLADKLNIRKNLPLIELIEVKKNKSFIAKKTKIFKEEVKIPNNAPVESVKIQNISKIKKTKKIIKKISYYNSRILL